MVGKQGFYEESRIGGIPQKYLDRFFTKTANGYQVKDELKNKVRFDYHNLKNDSGLRNLDIVFCRNVLNEACFKKCSFRQVKVLSAYTNASE